MSRTKYSEQCMSIKKLYDFGFMLKQCPATCGNPTTMDAKTWERLCNAVRRRETEKTKSGKDRTLESYCVRCKGKNIPDSLTIVDMLP